MRIPIRDSWRRLPSGKKIGVVIALLVVVSTVCLTIGRSAWMGRLGLGVQDDMVQFDAQESGFRIDRPRSWLELEFEGEFEPGAEAIGGVAAPQVAGPYVRVLKVQDPVEGLPSDRARDVIGVLMPDGSQLYSESEISTPHYSGFLYQYTYTMRTWTGTTPRLCYGFVTAVGRTGYVVTACASEQDWPQVEATFLRMIESFEVIDGLTPLAWECTVPGIGSRVLVGLAPPDGIRIGLSPRCQSDYSGGGQRTAVRRQGWAADRAA